jgi:CO dehydrogenase maturation factor
LVAGRGGTGKSTIVALLAQALAAHSRVLVVDADESNLTLGTMLGMQDPSATIMDILGGKQNVRGKLLESIMESMREINQKSRLFQEPLSLDQVSERYISSSDKISWVRIGKIEHSMEGCACPMGYVARSFLKSLFTPDNEWVVVDTEAGVEHFGRGVLEGVDMVLTIVEPSREAISTAIRVRDLCNEAGKQCAAILNKVNGQEEILRTELNKESIAILGQLPYANDVVSVNLAGDSLSSHVSIFPEVEKIAGALSAYLGCDHATS